MKSKIAIRLLTLALVGFASSACAPGLGDSLQVRDIPDVADLNTNLAQPIDPRASARIFPSDIKVTVKRFSDSRASTSVGEVNGRALQPEGDIGLSLQRAFERQLKKRGFILRLGGSPSLSGEVTDWRVEVTPNFPTSKADAHASIKLQVLDQNGVSLYTASYSGSAALEHPILDQDKVEEILTSAMGYAINEALRDDRLIAKISELDRS